MTAANARPCGMCRHLDARLDRRGAWCWETYAWRDPDAVVADCSKSERADGKDPPGRIRFPEEPS